MLTSPDAGDAATRYALTCEQEWELSGGGREDRRSWRTATYRVHRLDLDRCAAWLEDVLTTHDALRARLTRHGDLLEQHFDPQPRPITCPVRTFEADDPPGTVALALTRLLEGAPSEDCSPVSLAAGRVGDEGGCVTIAVHRAMVDDISFDRLCRSFERCYASGTREHATRAASYEDYVRSVTTNARASRVERNTDWWVDRTRTVDLAADRQIRGDHGPRYALQDLVQAQTALPTLGDLSRAADRQKVTVPALLLAACARALGDLADMRRLLVLVPATPGRMQGRASAIGNFVVPMYLALDLTGDPAGDVETIAAAMFEGLFRSPYSFTQWSDAFRKQIANLDRPPLITAFLYEETNGRGAGGDTPPDRAPLERLPELRKMVVPANYLEFRYVQEDNVGLTGSINYSSTSFRHRFAEELARHVTERVAAICGA